MALNANFGVVYKKHNSTVQGSHTLEVPVSLKDYSSIMTPSLIVNLSSSQIFTSSGTLNHVYIPHFGRYYYVANWTWENGVWRADCTVDVLATWKSIIGSSSQYILRASADSDGTVFDSMYPVKNAITETFNAVSPPWTVSDGYYVIGIINKQGSAFGAVNYYAFTAGGFSTLCDKLFGSDYLSSTEIAAIEQDMSMETWKSLYNPFQYIVSCVYVPVDISSRLTTATVYVGYWSLGLTAGKLVDVRPVPVTLTLTWPATPHPNESRGTYVYCGPYTEVDLDVQPFGHVQLPSDIVYADGGVSLAIEIDVITGVGTCYVGGRGSPYMTMQSMVGVTIQMAQMARDYMGTATTAISGVAGTVGAALSGDIAGAIASGASAIDSTVRSQVPRLSTLGRTGGFSALTTPVILIIRYRAIVDEDNNRLGRPLCKEKTISTIPGYILCENAAVNTRGTSEENSMIVDFMNGGFYYE